MSQAGTDEDVRVEEIGGSAGTEDTGNATERTENGTKEGPTEQLVNGVAPEELSEEQEALQNGEGQIMNDEGLATEDKQKICEGKDKSEDSNTVDSDAGDTDTVNLLSESVELSKSVEGGNDREGNGDNVSMNGVLPNGSVDLASDTLTDIESAKTDCDNLKDNGEDEGDETLHISVEENKIESEPLSREDSNLNSEDRKDDLQQVKVARRHRLSRSRSASTNSRKSLPDASEVKESPTSEKIDKRKRRLKKVNGDVSEGSGTKTDVVQSSNNEKTLHKEEVIKNSADVVKINKRKSSIKSTEEKVASKASSAPLDNIDLAILDVIERARNNEDFKLENGIPNDVPRYAKLNLGSKRASIGKSQTSPVISRKASRGRSPRSPMNVSVKSPLVKGQSKSPGKSPGRGKKRRFSTNRQRKASDISASIKTEETVEYSDSKAERKLVRKSSGEVVLSPPPVTSPKQLASPQKRMEQILKGSSPAGRGGGTASRGRKSFSPVSDPKGLGGFRGKRGPRAKMSLSPNHLNTVTIDSFFQPVTAKKPVAKKTLSYATPRKVKKEKIEPCTISSDAAAKALSALSTDLTPSKIPASESSDVENNPAVSSLVRESKMPKARKSFPRSKESSPADVDERLAGNTPSTGQKSSTSKESPSTKPSTNSSSVPMTFKLQELESVFGIKNKSLGKLDAKTLDKIVLDRAQECKKSNPASGIKPEEALPKMQSGVYGNDVTSQLTVAYAKSNAAVTAAVTADPNFASLLTRQKILKKRRPMGKYKLPGNKKKQKKKPKDAITPSKQDMNSKPQAEGSDTAQNGIPHEEPLNIDSKNSSQDIVVNGEDESESVEDDTNASRKVVDSSLDSKDVSPSKRKTGSCSELKLTICANNETGQFTVHTPGSDKSKSPRIPSPGKVQNKISDNEFVDDDEDKDSALGLQAQPTRRSYIRRGRGGYRRRRNWAMGVIPKQKVKPKDGGVQSKVSESKTDLSHESSASLTLPIGHLDADSPSPQPGNKRKWANSGQKSTKVSILASKTPDKSTPTEQKLSRSSKRKKPVSLPACDQAVADDDTIPALSLVDTSLPAGRRESLENAEPPQISPQKVVGTSMFFEHNKPSPTKRLRMQRDTSTPSDAQASPSPPGTTYQRASVCLGAVPGEIQYKIEGARVSHHQQQGGQPGIGRRRRELHGDVAPQRFHNTPNGVTYPVTPPRTPEDGSLAGEDSHTASPEVDPKGADRAPDYLPVCCCRLTGVKMTNNIPVSSKQPLFCQALDSVNNKIVACPLRVSCSQLVRPALAIPFMVLCEAHRGRLKLHQCCPGCGQFCTEGKFIECESEKKEGSRPVHHHYHRHCQTYRANKYFCPHCGKEATQNETHLKLSSSSSAVLVHVSPAPTLGPASTTDMPPALPLSRTARMGSVSSRRDSATSGADSTGGDGISVGVPATDARIHTKKLVGPSRKELEYAILTLDGDRAKKLRAGAKNLFRACRVGDTEKVLVLLADGADPNKRYEEDDHQVALHAAATSGHDLLVHVLLQAGANHHCADAGLRTPLMCAAEGGHLGVLRALARVGAQVNAKGSDGMSSIHLAAQAGKVDAVRFLLETGKTGVNVKDDGGWTPLIWAAEHSHIEVVHYLLHSGADPNIKDNEGNTALHWAAFSGSVDIAEIFLNADCDLESINELGDRPLHIAARQDHYETVVLLLARGADVEARNNANEAPISCCTDNDSLTWMALRVNKQLRGFHTRKIPREERLLHSASYLFRDVSFGREANAIPVVNVVDDANYPRDFLYVMDNIETTPMNVNRVITSLQSCSCRENCGTVFCRCSHASIKCWYERTGQLTRDFNFADPPLIFECNKACRCWATCPNRVVQLGITCRLQVFRTPGRGWGARTLLDIQKGTFVCEYIGELICDAEADSREDDSYLFDLDNKDADTFCIDARRYGNVARFINHLCDPNLTPVKVFVDHQDLRFPRICFFASRDIKAHEELGFDYGEKFWIIKWKQFTCTCGGAKCRYSKDTIHKTIQDYNRRMAEEMDNGT